MASKILGEWFYFPSRPGLPPSESPAFPSLLCVLRNCLYRSGRSLGEKNHGTIKGVCFGCFLCNPASLLAAKQYSEKSLLPDGSVTRIPAFLGESFWVLIFNPYNVTLCLKNPARIALESTGLMCLNCKIRRNFYCFLCLYTDISEGCLSCKIVFLLCRKWENWWCLPHWEEGRVLEQSFGMTVGMLLGTP